MKDMIGKRVPDTIFKDVYLTDITTADYFAGKRVILYSIVGAFKPSLDATIPSFELLYHEFRSQHKIDDIYCISVNDPFVMNAWKENQKFKNVKVIADGNGEFTYSMGMFVAKHNIYMNWRSWRYAAIVDDGVIEAWFEEPGKQDLTDEDTYKETSAETVMNYLRALSVEKERGK